MIRINKHLHKIFERILKKVERPYFLLTQPARLKWRQYNLATDQDCSSGLLSSSDCKGGLMT